MTLLTHLKIGNTIIAGYLIALLLMAAIGSLALVQIMRINTTVADLADNLSVDQDIAEQLVADILSIRFHANRYIRSQATQDLEHFQEELSNVEHFITQKAQLEISVPERIQLLNNIKKGIQDYATYMTEVTELMRRRSQILMDVLNVQGKVAEEQLEQMVERAFQMQDTPIVYHGNHSQHLLLLMRLEVFQYLNSGNKEWLQRIQELYQEIKKSLATLKQTIQPELTQQQQLLQTAQTAIQEYYQGFSRLSEHYEHQNQLIKTQLDVIGPKLLQEARAMAKSVHIDFAHAHQASQALVQRTQWWLVSVIIAAMIISLILGILIRRSIMTQLGGEPARVAEIAHRIAAGDLSMSFERHQRQTGLLATIQEMQSQLRQRIDADKRITEHALRISRALDKATTYILITDNHYHIIYLNEAAQHFFKTEEARIRAELPHFDGQNILGQNIDFFHKKPSNQHHLLEQLKGSHHAQIILGGLTLDHIITPVFNDQEQLLGFVIEFTNRTTEVAMEQEINRVIQAASQGHFDQRISLEHKSGFFKTFSESINTIMAFNQQMIEDILKLFSALAQGDLTQKIKGNYTGVFEQLKQDANTTVERLIAIMTVIKQTSEVVSQAAQEISQGNQNLSQRTEQQAASLQQTAASMEQMTSSVQQNADNARKASQLATKTKEQATQGFEVVKTNIAAMNAINQSSKRITDIISVINDIAFQTNLLALNAAVEAARAGEQGRGFAVVATEVRHLAQRSAEAAKQIKTLIQDSVTQVEDGTRLADQSGKTLKEIVVAITQVSDIVTEISAASQEQSAGIHQVNKAITQMDEMTQQNAALVEQAAAASESMSDQAVELKQHMAFFKVDASTTTINRPAASSSAQWDDF